MQAQILAPKPFPFDAVSPYLEMGAYEALWSRRKMSFKALADLMRDSPTARLSTFVDGDEAGRFATRVFERLHRAGVGDFGVHVRPDYSYPKKLLDAEHPVELLYYRGSWDLVYTPSIAIVGTRKPTADGVKRARSLARHFVDKDYTVVSGLAAGIDTAAHRAAIEHGGSTIAVIGTPVDQVYPKANSDLQQLIAREHLLISQIPVWRYGEQGPAGNRLFFPERNVTMSAITVGTVIVEAGDTSGTLIQARAALKQGRQLFILESCFQNKDISWPQRYIERPGVHRVRNFDDIMSVLGDAEQAVEN